MSPFGAGRPGYGNVRTGSRPSGGLGHGLGGGRAGYKRAGPHNGPRRLVSREGLLAKVRVPRKGVTQAEVATVLSRRLGTEFQVAADGRAGVIARRSPLSAASGGITSSPGGTVFRVRRIGLPVVSLGTARIVDDALRRSPEF